MCYVHWQAHKLTCGKLTYFATTNIVNSGQYAIRTENGGTNSKRLYKEDFSVNASGVSEVGWHFYIDQKDFDDISGIVRDTDGGGFSVNYDRETTSTVHIMGDDTGFSASVGEWYEIHFYNIDANQGTADYELINSNDTVKVQGSGSTSSMSTLDRIRISHANYPSQSSNTKLVHDDFYIM